MRLFSPDLEYLCTTGEIILSPEVACIIYPETKIVWREGCGWSAVHGKCICGDTAEITLPQVVIERTTEEAVGGQEPPFSIKHINLIIWGLAILILYYFFFEKGPKKGLIRSREYYKGRIKW